jgi:hypothetical protein
LDIVKKNEDFDAVMEETLYKAREMSLLLANLAEMVKEI